MNGKPNSTRLEQVRAAKRLLAARHNGERYEFFLVTPERTARIQAMARADQGWDWSEEHVIGKIVFERHMAGICQLFDDHKCPRRHRIYAA